MVQRSLTLVVYQSDYCERIIGPLHSAQAVAKGITTDEEDILLASVPLRLLEPSHRALRDGIGAGRNALYQCLRMPGSPVTFPKTTLGSA